MQNIIQLVVERQIIGVSTQLVGPRNATIAHILAQHGSPAQLQQILGMNPDLSVVDGFGYTVMHYACMGGNQATFAFLAEKAEDLDLDVDAISHGGKTCLMAAIDSRSPSTVSAVLE